MKDSQNLDVTFCDERQITLINQATYLLFTKRDGLEKLLLQILDTDCPILQIYAGLINFFSFSQQSIQENIAAIVNRLAKHALNDRENLYVLMLQELCTQNFAAALDTLKNLIDKYPTDKVALLMLETCGFLGGIYERLESIYVKLLPCYGNNSTFLGMVGFLYCHLNRKEDAKVYVQRSLAIDCNDAWLQHVFAHTVDEISDDEVSQMIIFQKTYAFNWCAHSKFFEGHNWMHLLLLQLKQPASFSISDFWRSYESYIWNESKESLAIQNNAFLVLWQAEFMHLTPNKKYWEELALYAIPYIHNYFTPYLTITTILAVAKINMNLANQAAQDFKKHAESYEKNSLQYRAWYDTALPILNGCLAYLAEDYFVAIELLESVKSTQLLGHSDEQRAIFSSFLENAKEKFFVNQIRFV